MLQLGICELEHCYVINGHAGDQYLDVLFSFVFFSFFFFFFFFLHFFQNHSLIEATRQHLPFWNSNFMCGPEFLKKIAYNGAFAVSVRLAMACFRAHILLSPFRLVS